MAHEQLHLVCRICGEFSLHPVCAVCARDITAATPDLLTRERFGDLADLERERVGASR